MKTFFNSLLIGLISTPTLAHHDKTPLREAVVDGHSHAVGGATLWLAGAMVAMVLAMVAVQKSVFRKR